MHMIKTGQTLFCQFLCDLEYLRPLIEPSLCWDSIQSPSVLWRKYVPLVDNKELLVLKQSQSTIVGFAEITVNLDSIRKKYSVAEDQSIIGYFQDGSPSQTWFASFGTSTCSKKTTLSVTLLVYLRCTLLDFLKVVQHLYTHT